jgi:translation initiation factor IF-3
MRVASYEKMIYELKKNAKKNKQTAKPLKEIQLSVNISEHDLQTKANNAKKFIENGNKVKVTLTMKGRELSRRDENKKSILEFIVMLEDVAIPESQLRDDGNKTIVVLKKKG